MGWQIPVLKQIANDPRIKIILIIPEQSSDQDGLRN